MTRLKLPFAALLLTSLALASSIPRSTPAQNANPKRSVLELDFSLDAQGRPLLAWVEQVSAAQPSAVCSAARARRVAQVG